LPLHLDPSSIYAFVSKSVMFVHNAKQTVLLVLIGARMPMIVDIGKQGDINMSVAAVDIVLNKLQLL
jgi:hypothetical protein